MESKRSFEDLRENWLGAWLDLRRLWSDRRAILFDLNGVIDGDVSLSNRPWPFAVQAALLPTTIVFAVVGFFCIFVDLPPTPAERLVALYGSRVSEAMATRERLLPAARMVEVPVPLNVPIEDLEQSLERAELEVERLRGSGVVDADAWSRAIRQHRRYRSAVAFRRVLALNDYIERKRMQMLLWKLVRYVMQLMFACLPVWVGLQVILSSVIFQWLTVKTRAPFDLLHDAGAAYLYLMSAALMLPNLAAGVAFLTFDLASRYFFTEQYFPLVSKVAIAGVLALLLYIEVRMLSIVKRLAMALRPFERLTRAQVFWHMFGRVVATQYLVGWAMEIILLVIIVCVAVGIDVAERIRWWIATA